MIRIVLGSDSLLSLVDELKNNKSSSHDTISEDFLLLSKLSLIAENYLQISKLPELEDLAQLEARNMYTKAFYKNILDTNSMTPSASTPG